jgi:hypothetical protein
MLPSADAPSEMRPPSTSSRVIFVNGPPGSSARQTPVLWSATQMCVDQIASVTVRASSNGSAVTFVQLSGPLRR